MAASPYHRFFANKLWNAGRFLLGNLKGINQEERESLAVSGPMTAAEVPCCWVMTARDVIAHDAIRFSFLKVKIVGEYLVHKF